ncbi:amino acid ABC transporter permease [Gilliamella sp. Choc4-2]|jgi:glutamate/aspartate transport system permease protein|uniref:amino acid ABC transporter permease n=1 Tax=unclassified Gilliamella TaxID=2685620 RepID=UPI0004DD724E|nr:amino acid ABC transporter permease [Gilliamella apicola]KFA59487.1 Glutamate Aspartate transport system permease protein GltJ [Gilliamella apicola]OCG31097.1 amino acid ABC transporter permease [Gilliamella apicola]OCG46714.1 amino acid ABC transporter permease [Gilliamella apicola]OCG56474.1 amino acid ABC transporter permease [Gilliamella apicola]OCG62857.1 amino acid ABC transporter permease [Gilliamella apicola]
MTTSWNWGIFLQPTPFGDTTYLGWLWLGFQMTILLVFTSGLVAFFVGSLFGVLRTLPNRFLSTLGTCYVEIFRNIPLIIHLFFWIEVVPILVPESIRDWLYNDIDPMTFTLLMSTIGLGLFTGARICEQIRAAIQSIPIGQKNAGIALGLTLKQIYLYILLPNAYRRVIPPLTSEMLNMVKNSAVASTVGYIELTKQANQLLEHAGQPYESFIAITLGYVLINVVIMFAMQYIEKKVRLPGILGGKS